MVRVYINGVGIDAPSSATALDAVRLSDASAAAEIEAGRRRITDSRGLPERTDAPIFGGAIFRVVASRSRDTDDAAP